MKASEKKGHGEEHLTDSNWSTSSSPTRSRSLEHSHITPSCLGYRSFPVATLSGFPLKVVVVAMRFSPSKERGGRHQLVGGSDAWRNQ